MEERLFYRRRGITRLVGTAIVFLVMIVAITLTKGRQLSGINKELVQTAEEYRSAMEMESVVRIECGYASYEGRGAFQIYDQALLDQIIHEVTTWTGEETEASDQEVSTARVRFTFYHETGDVIEKLVLNPEDSSVIRIVGEKKVVLQQSQKLYDTLSNIAEWSAMQVEN